MSRGPERLINRTSFPPLFATGCTRISGRTAGRATNDDDDDDDNEHEEERALKHPAKPRLGKRTQRAQRAQRAQRERVYKRYSRRARGRCRNRVRYSWQRSRSINRRCPWQCKLIMASPRVPLTSYRATLAVVFMLHTRKRCLRETIKHTTLKVL